MILLDCPDCVVMVCVDGLTVVGLDDGIPGALIVVCVTVDGLGVWIVDVWIQIVSTSELTCHDTIQHLPLVEPAIRVGANGYYLL